VPLSTETHARRFLNVGDLDAQAMDLLPAAMRWTKEQDGWPTLKRIEDWTTAQLRQLGVQLRDAPRNNDVLDVMASIHLVARRVPGRLRRPSARRARYVAAFLDSLEPDFIPELLKETRRRKRADRTFAAELNQSRGAVEDFVRQASELRAETRASLPSESADVPDRPVALQDTDDAAIMFAVVGWALLIGGLIISWATSDPGKDAEDDDEGGDGDGEEE
jgi:uncharacterized protein (DUF2236 family)